MKKIDRKQSFDDFSDEQLIGLIQARGGSHAAAYGALIHRHQPDLLRRCRARLGNHTDAEEAVQETLLRVFRGLRHFRGESAFRTWLFSIGDNQCSTLYQRRSRQIMSEHLRALIALHQEIQHADPSGMSDVPVQHVHEVLALLPSHARDVLMLRFYRDLPLEVIAKTLGIGLSAAKMRLYRALGQFESEFNAARHAHPA